MPTIGGGTFHLTKRPATQAVRRSVAGGFARASRLNHPLLPADDDDGLRAAAADLARSGFRYVLLHRDGYADADAFEAACRAAAELFGAPYSETRERAVWPLRAQAAASPPAPN